MKKRVFLSLCLSFFVVLFAVSFVSAQSTDDANTENESVDSTDVDAALDEVVDEDVAEVLDEVENEEDELEGVEVQEPTSVPSGFGLFLRDWRERISLVLTLDPVKKAEKQLLYAEERIKIAEKISEESNNPRAQEKAQKMIEQANKHIEKIEERKEKWSEKVGEDAERLRKNLATHHLRRDKALERIEERVPEEAREKFEELREKMLENGKQFLNAIDNEQLPEKVREHLQNVRDRVEKHSEAVKDYREQKMEILKDYEGEENGEKREQLKDLWETRKSKLQGITLEFKTEKENLKELAEQGSEDAKEKLEQLNKAKDVLKVKMENAHDRLEKVRELREDGIKKEDRLEKLEELREEQLDKVKERLESVREMRENKRGSN